MLNQEDKELGVAIGAVVRSARKTAGLEQCELARRMGSPRTYVSKVERAKSVPNIISLSRFATALDTTAWELLRRAEKKLDQRSVRSVRGDNPAQPAAAA